MLTDEQAVYLRLMGLDAAVVQVFDEYKFEHAGTFMLHRMAHRLRDWLAEREEVTSHEVIPVITDTLKLNVKLLLTAFGDEWLDFDITIT